MYNVEPWQYSDTELLSHSLVNTQLATEPEHSVTAPGPAGQGHCEYLIYFDDQLEITTSQSSLIKLTRIPTMMIVIQKTSRQSRPALQQGGGGGH